MSGGEAKPLPLGWREEFERMVESARRTYAGGTCNPAFSAFVRHDEEYSQPCYCFTLAALMDHEPETLDKIESGPGLEIYGEIRAGVVRHWPAVTASAVPWWVCPTCLRRDEDLFTLIIHAWDIHVQDVRLSTLEEGSRDPVALLEDIVTKAGEGKS